MHKSEHIITSRHYLILSVIAFATGIIYATSAPSVLLPLSIRFLTVMLIAAFVMMVVFGLIKPKKSKKPFLLPIFLILMILLGIFRVFGELVSSPNSLQNYQGDSVWLTGTLRTNPVITKNGYSCYFEMEVFQINDVETKPERIMLFIPKTQGVKLSKGNQIYSWTKINLPDENSEGWPYTYETHLKGKDIYFTGSVKNANRVSFDEPFSVISTVKHWGEVISDTLTSAVDANNPVNRVETSILKGILVGDKSDFSDKLYEQFSFAGLSHIVAVSGMHLSILFSAIMLIFGTLKVKRRISLLLAVPPVILFAATAKFTPSVCRASIMIIMMLTATIAGKRYSSVNALFLSLGIILAVSPYSVYSQSLTLSFFATLGILVYYKYISYFGKKLAALAATNSDICNNIISTVLGFIISSMSISLSVTIATAYFSLLFFDSLSWIQLFTNIWIIPTVTVAFCLGYLVCIFYYIFPSIAMLLNYPLNFFLNVISKTTEIFGQNQYTIQISTPNKQWIYLIIYLSLAILLYLVLKTAYDLSKERESLSSPHRRSKMGIPRL